MNLVTDVNIKIMMEAVNYESNVENVSCEMPVGCRREMFGSR